MDFVVCHVLQVRFTMFGDASHVSCAIALTVFESNTLSTMLLLFVSS